MPRCAGFAAPAQHEWQRWAMTSALVFVATATTYAIATLVATGRLSGNRLMAALVVAAIPPAALIFLNPEQVGEVPRMLGLPAMAGLPFAGLVRSLRGWDRPLWPATPVERET